MTERIPEQELRRTLKLTEDGISDVQGLSIHDGRLSRYIASPALKDEFIKAIESAMEISRLVGRQEALCYALGEGELEPTNLADFMSGKGNLPIDPVKSIKLFERRYR